MVGQKINTRLTFAIVVQVAILVIIALIAGFGMSRANGLVNELNALVGMQTKLANVSQIVFGDLRILIDGLDRGVKTWEEGQTELQGLKKGFETGWAGLTSDLIALDKEHYEKQYQPTVPGVQEALGELDRLVAGRDKNRLGLFIANDLDALLNPFLEAQKFTVKETGERSTGVLGTAQTTTNTLLVLTVILAVLGFAVIFSLSTATYRAIMNPINKMMTTVNEVKEGNYMSRTELRSGADELSQLGSAFDQMLDERVSTLVEVEHENERLNDSVINLLQAVSQLSQRDLTVKVPVTEDMTGPVADALNLLTGETAKVLRGVTRISEEVAVASEKVKAQSDTVIAVADHERQIVERTATDLASAATAMKQIADLAQVCNTTAEAAIKTTQAALQTVTNTVSGINSTRDTIRETEKRIKRLGERSQEISGVVNLINTIAERTHILALNASMHAASAGEAGRGFAVVADEVQRLAENAREATSQIAALVSNIQIETADTVNAMNIAISQVVDGSRLAEQAGDQMKLTQETTAELGAAVQQIASRSQEQARISSDLLDRAQEIQEGTRQTSEQLKEQTIQTTNLVEYAKGLLGAVRVFHLPD